MNNRCDDLRQRPNQRDQEVDTCLNDLGDGTQDGRNDIVDDFGNGRDNSCDNLGQRLDQRCQ